MNDLILGACKFSLPLSSISADDLVTTASRDFVSALALLGGVVPCLNTVVLSLPFSFIDESSINSETWYTFVVCV
jgi:hypothetical protein